MTDKKNYIKLDNYFSYKKAVKENSTIKVKSGDKGNKISENLFGLFTEHLGKNVYGGAWSQVFANSGFEAMKMNLKDVPDSHKPDLEQKTKERNEIIAKQFGNDLFKKYEKLGVAPYWAPINRHGEFSLEKGMRGDAQKIVFKNNDKSNIAGIETPIYLPIHRIKTYNFNIKINFKGKMKKSPEYFTCQIWMIRGEKDKSFDKEKLNEITPLGLDRELPYKNINEELITEEKIKLFPVEEGNWAHKKTVFELDSNKKIPEGARLKFKIIFNQPGTYLLDEAQLFPADALYGWDPEVVKLLKDMNLSCLRFPGGNFTSGYHWQEGIGPLEERPEKPNPAWPEWESNQVGTDEWLILCELIGAEPIICINAGNGTPEEAANWIRYCNDPKSTTWGKKRAQNGHPEPYHVEKWEVGNELWGDFQINWATSEEYGNRFKKFASAMKSADSSIKLIAIGGSMPDVIQSDKNKRNKNLLGANYAKSALNNYKDKVWAIAEHAVMGWGIPNDFSATNKYQELIAHTHHIGDMLKENKNILSEIKEETLITQTEQMLAISGKDNPSDRSVAAAIVWAGFVNWFIRSEGLVPLFTRSALINHGDLLEKVRGKVYPLPGYWGQLLYTMPQERYPLKVKVESPLMSPGGNHFKRASEIPVIDSVAFTNKKEDKISLIVVNRDSEKNLETKLKFDQFECKNIADKFLLAGESFTSTNEWYHPNNITPDYEEINKNEDNNFNILLPSCSVTLLTFEKV